jgi:hypothetical protein
VLSLELCLKELGDWEPEFDETTRLRGDEYVADIVLEMQQVLPKFRTVEEAPKNRKDIYSQDSFDKLIELVSWLRAVQIS